VKLEARGLRFAYGRRDVLAGVDLDARAGELVGIIGPNGSGKSTLLRLLAGLDRPSAGHVRVQGLDLTRLSDADRARHVAWLPQLPRVAFAFTALQVVLLGRTARAEGLLDRPADRAAAEAALAAVEALALADRPIDALSGGERQRVFLAQALAQGAPLLLLDEPTAHLDPGQAIAVWGAIGERVRAEGRAAVAVLHDVNLAAQFCDRVVVLEAGRVVAEGVPAAVIDAGLLARVFGIRAHVGRHPEAGVPFVVPLRP
jgi:iron complex transport system ATP-binding protein